MNHCFKMSSVVLIAVNLGVLVFSAFAWVTGGFETGTLAGLSHDVGTVFRGTNVRFT